jgi:hypothetical protein
MTIRWMLAAVIAVGLAVSTVELSCRAAELFVEQAHEAASIPSAVPEGDLSVVVDGDPDVTLSLAYTR